MKKLMEKVRNIARNGFRAALFGLSLGALALSYSCIEKSRFQPKYGKLEGKVVKLTEPNLAPPAFAAFAPFQSGFQGFQPQATIEEVPNAKLCLIKGHISNNCSAEAITDSEGNYSILTYAGTYNKCVDADHDGFYDECDITTIKPGKVVDEGKRQIECKIKKPFNCFIGLNKQNYCPGEVMNISIMCKGTQGTPYTLTGKFVNEKEHDVIYDIIDIGSGDGNFSLDISYPLPTTWPATNSQPGADWKIYLISNSSHGSLLEDKDNFNILDNACNLPPGQLGLEVIIENGAESINFTNDVNTSFIPSSSADELTYCVAEENQCIPQENYVPFRDNVIVSLPGQSGLKHVCGKVKKLTITSNISCDSIFVDLLAPSIEFTTAEQTNLDSGESWNDLHAEACISDNVGIKKVIGRIYDSNNNLIKEEELSFVEDSSCALPGEKGYRVSITISNLEEDTYKIKLTAIDLATNSAVNQTSVKLDLTPPTITKLESLDHLLATYVVFHIGSGKVDAETYKGLNGSEFRYAHKYASGGQSCDSAGNCYNGLLDIIFEAQDESGIAKYIVDWGDGSIEIFTSTQASHAYASDDVTKTGDYLVKVKACDTKNNCSNYSSPIKVKIVMTQEDADLAFWGNVKKNVPGLVPVWFGAYNCDAAIASGEEANCAIRSNDWRRVSLINLGAIMVFDIYNTAHEIGHVYVTPEKHDHVGDENYNDGQYCVNNLPAEDGLANCEIMAGADVWYKARGPPHPIEIIPTDYNTFTTTECSDLSQNLYEKLYCAYKFEDDRGDF